MPTFNQENFYIDLTNRTLKRYEWEDRLVYLCRLGYISSGTLNTCMRLASAMNWKLGGELKWDNDSAFLEVGIGRSTFYNKRYELLASGVLSKKSNNYIASIPTKKQLDAYEQQVGDRINKKFTNYDTRSKALLEKKAKRKNWIKETQKSEGDNL